MSDSNGAATYFIAFSGTDPKYIGVSVYYERIGTCGMELKTFFNKLVAVTDEVDPRFDETKKPLREWSLRDELDIDGMFVAWVWYIIAMFLVTFLRGNVAGWIFFTYEFVQYRNKKLIEYGYKRAKTKKGRFAQWVEDLKRKKDR